MSLRFKKIAILFFFFGILKWTQPLRKSHFKLVYMILTFTGLRIIGSLEENYQRKFSVFLTLLLKTIITVFNTIVEVL